MTAITPQIDISWEQALNKEFEGQYFAAIKQYLLEEKKSGQITYPPDSLIFNAFNLTPFDDVKVIILGQDPYHGSGQAHGLCFSVSNGIKPPPSLANIYKELKTDLGIPVSNSGNLTKWAKQGVFLLNTFLTVRKGHPASHSKIGWQQFTDSAIQALSAQRLGLIFLLWGKFAQKKIGLIDADKHHILQAPHPSPFSVHRGFFGCRHFSKTNTLLEHKGYNPIDWELT